MRSLEANVFKIIGIAVTGAVVLGALRSDRARGAVQIIGGVAGGVSTITRDFLR